MVSNLPIWAQQKGSHKKGREEGHSANNKIVTNEHTINIHKCIHGVGFNKCDSWALKEIRKFAVEMRTPDMQTPGSTKLSRPK